MKASATITKVVRLIDASILKELRAINPECNISVLHLMRDPRGSILSRMVSIRLFVDIISNIEYFLFYVATQLNSGICNSVNKFTGLIFDVTTSSSGLK